MSTDKPRANPPICWVCDRKLSHGGWRYATVQDVSGRPHPAHGHCAALAGAELEAS